MPQTMPLVPLRDLVVFPGTTFQFVIGRPRSLRALDVASRRENRVFLAVQRDKSIDDPGPGDVESVGSVCDIVQRMKHRPGILCTIVQTLQRSESPVQVLVNGLNRGSALEFRESQGFFEVAVEAVPREGEGSSGEPNAELASKVVAVFDRYVKLSRSRRGDEVLVALRGIADAGRLADVISSHLPINVERKQRLLETSSVREHLKRLLDILQTEIDDSTEREPASRVE